jgi:redox-sensing transcriptional repressor
MVQIMVAEKVISRLSLYRSALQRLKTYGMPTIYSCDIADTLGITAMQVRKDFSKLKISGKKKVGYNIDQLVRDIDRLLQKSEVRHAVLCGYGRNGAALFIDQLIKSQGLIIDAVFDDPQSAGNDITAIGDISVQPLETLFRFVSQNGIQFGIIATSDHRAQRMMDLLVLSGIKGVLNLSGADLKCPNKCVINSVSVAREFEKIVYYVNNGPNGKGKMAV